MKHIDRMIDYIADRVLDRVDERRPRVKVTNTNNVSHLLVGSGTSEDKEFQKAYDRVQDAQARLHAARRKASGNNHA